MKTVAVGVLAGMVAGALAATVFAVAGLRWLSGPQTPLAWEGVE